MADQNNPLRPFEGIARATDRRTFLRRAFQTGFAAAVAIASGSFGATGRILAASSCPCTYPRGVSCGSIGYSCPWGGGCPSGCKICETAACPDWCGYATGWWWSCGCGPGGSGCHKCYDCTCPSSATGCNGSCGCRSGQCWCCGCLTAEDIAREMERYSTDRAA